MHLNIQNKCGCGRTCYANSCDSIAISVLYPQGRIRPGAEAELGGNNGSPSFYFKWSTFQQILTAMLTSLALKKECQQDRTARLRVRWGCRVTAPMPQSGLSSEKSEERSCASGQGHLGVYDQDAPFKERMHLPRLRGKRRSCQPVPQPSSNPRPLWYLTSCCRLEKPDALGSPSENLILRRVSGGSNRSVRKCGLTKGWMWVTAMGLRDRVSLSHAFFTLTSLEHGKIIWNNASGIKLWERWKKEGISWPARSYTDLTVQMVSRVPRYWTWLFYPLPTGLAMCNS